MTTQKLLQFVAILSLFAMFLGLYNSVLKAKTVGAAAHSQNRAGMLVDVILALVFSAIYYGKIFSPSPAAPLGKASGVAIALGSILQGLIFLPVFIRLYVWYKNGNMQLGVAAQAATAPSPYASIPRSEISDYTEINLPDRHTARAAARIGFGNGLLCILLPPMLCIGTLLLCQNYLYGLLAKYGLDFSLQNTINMAKAASFEQQLGLCVATVIMAPLLEELFFRGYLFRLLKQSYGALSAMVINGLIFGVIHNNLFALLPLWVFGAALAWSYQRSGRIIYPILAHALFNGMSMYGIISGNN